MTLTPITSLGIDLSTAATGLVLLRSNDTPYPDVLFQKEISAKGQTGLRRARSIILDVMLVLHQHNPDKIVMEGYSLNVANRTSIVPLVELGGLLRFMLLLDELQWFDPRASELKKFATGKGNSQKDVVMMHVLKRWNFISASNNIADAYVLACMGLAHARRLPGITLDMQKIVGDMPIRSE
jgi:crossover junction endodeoxyribonuclease RuvC